MFNHPKSVELVVQQAHSHPESENLRSFVLGAQLHESALYLHQEELDELHQVVVVEISGEFRFTQQPLEMEIRQFREQPFAYGSTTVPGASALVVAALDEALDITKIMARFTQDPVR